MIYNRFADPLFRYLYARCGDASQVEELHSDLWLRIVERLDVVGAVPGTWTIGGLIYAVTAETQLRTGGTDFVVNDCVEVHFQSDNTGKRMAVRIEREDSECRVGERGRVFGTVEVMPSGTYTGTWEVSGESYTVNNQSSSSRPA